MERKVFKKTLASHWDNSHSMVELKKGRYIIFAAQQCYPDSGMEDAEFTFNTYEEYEEYCPYYSGDDGLYYSEEAAEKGYFPLVYFQIFDVETFQYIYFYSRDLKGDYRVFLNHIVHAFLYKELK